VRGKIHQQPHCSKQQQRQADNSEKRKADGSDEKRNCTHLLRCHLNNVNIATATATAAAARLKARRLAHFDRRSRT
jgi:hypothetical protein